MKIGAYNLSSQFNMYSKLSADTIKQADKVVEAGKLKDIKPVKEGPVDSLTISNSINKPVSATYSRYTPIGVLNSKESEVLDDFSLVSAKEDKIVSRLSKTDNNINYEQTISDEKMDAFLKDVFKLF